MCFSQPCTIALADTVTNRAADHRERSTLTWPKAVGFLERAARFAMPSSGWGFAYDWLRTAFTDLLAQGSAPGGTLERRSSDDFNNALLAYDALPAGTSDADRFAALQAAELLVSSTARAIARDSRTICGSTSPPRATTSRIGCTSFADLLIGVGHIIRDVAQFRRCAIYS